MPGTLTTEKSPQALGDGVRAALVDQLNNALERAMENFSTYYFLTLAAHGALMQAPVDTLDGLTKYFSSGSFTPTPQSSFQSGG